MSMYLGLSFRFLDRAFHGRTDGGGLEWPPSPLRVFQALLAARAALSRRTGDNETTSALRWLENLPPPIIVAPSVSNGGAYGLAVPNNDLDIVAAVWAKGGVLPKDPRALKSVKTVRANRLDSDDAVSYLWRLDDPTSAETRRHVEKICWLARHVVALGWGVDLVVGNGSYLSEEDLDTLPGERWMPGASTGGPGLRAPVPGTLDDLVGRHQAFLNRLGDDQKFTLPPPLRVFDVVSYRLATRPGERPFAAFSILKPDGSGFRPFDTTRRALTVAGMVRHATATAAKNTGKTQSWIDSFVLGHREGNDQEGHAACGFRRFAYLPIPSIERRDGGGRKAGDVRRVILMTFADDGDSEIAWARHAVSGSDLLRESDGQVVAVLSLTSKSDFVIQQYVKPATSWVTVTPVVLPGFDDPRHLRRRLKSVSDAQERQRLLALLDARVDALIRKAIVQAGYNSVLARHARLEVRHTGFMAGVECANRYGVPEHLKRFPRVHVRLEWRDDSDRPVSVPGPICIGGGRHYGLGLFVADEG